VVGFKEVYFNFSMPLAERHTSIVKRIANELDFFYCGISKARFLEEEAPHLEQWLNSNFHGQMWYMENYFDKRLDPRLLVDGAKSVVTLLLNYFPEKKVQHEDNFRFSTYAYGEDYHTVIKDKLKCFMDTIRTEIGEVGGRVFVDSAPVMDKAWAKHSGAGWMGKHTNIITKSNGSFFFIAELILDIDLVPDGPIKDYCGTCTRCIDACPTEAIVQPYVLDASKCISYLTIELKEALIDTNFQSKMDNWIFGCDICQDVCPWNRFSTPHQEPRFQPKEGMLELLKSDWTELTEEVFNEFFSKSAVKRAKYNGLMRNIRFVNGEDPHENCP
jgi:epoxyqueuosine reductase